MIPARAEAGKSTRIAAGEMRDFPPREAENIWNKAVIL